MFNGPADLRRRLPGSKRLGDVVNAPACIGLDAPSTVPYAVIVQHAIFGEIASDPAQESIPLISFIRTSVSNTSGLHLAQRLPVPGRDW